MLTVEILTNGLGNTEYRTIEIVEAWEERRDLLAHAAAEGDSALEGFYVIVYESRISPVATHVEPMWKPREGHEWGWGSNFVYAPDATPDRIAYQNVALGFHALPLFDLEVSLT